jgi:predicted ATPase
VRLFVERAGAASPDFSLDETNARAVAELCFRLDGIPLALEMAAARTFAVSPEQMLERLGRTLDVVCGEARAKPTVSAP